MSPKTYGRCRYYSDLSMSTGLPCDHMKLYLKQLTRKSDAHGCDEYGNCHLKNLPDNVGDNGLPGQAALAVHESEAGSDNSRKQTTGSGRSNACLSVVGRAIIWV